MQPPPPPLTWPPSPGMGRGGGQGERERERERDGMSGNRNGIEMGGVGGWEERGTRRKISGVGGAVGYFRMRVT